MKETMSGTYKTTHYNEQEYSKVEDGPKLTLAEKESTFEGGIPGERHPSQQHCLPERWISPFHRTRVHNRAYR